MQPPPGYTKAKKGEVCKLKKSIYGLKQASRQWNLEFTAKLRAFGFSQSAHDHCLFKYQKGGDCLFLLIYVDDVLLMGSSHVLIKQVKTYLHDAFTIKDLGIVKYFLGMEFIRSAEGIFVSQTKYAMDILRDAGMMNCTPVTTPFPAGLKFTANDKDTTPLLSNADQYRRMVGRLLYLNYTRPDITYVVQQLSQFIHSPRDSHWQAAIHVLRYLAGCSSQGLYYSANNNLQLTTYCDANWGACQSTRHSLTGYFLFLGDSLVS